MAVTKENVKRFNFAKKPKRPGFLMNVAKEIISRPDLKKRGFELKKTDMHLIQGPYLLLVTHSSMVDFNIMLIATEPNSVNNVMTLEGFKDYTEPLMRHLGVLGTRKFVQDIHLIKNMKYCIDELGTVFALYPEARYSLDGCTSYLPDSLGKMVKILNVPVAVLKIHGNFVTCPQWNKINKKTYVEAELKCILTAPQVKELKYQEINETIREHFEYDDFKWQYEKQLKIDHPLRANGLHCLLYKCASCKEEGKMHSEGTELWCEACGKRWEMDEYGRLKATEGETEYPHIPDWSKWERECVRKEIEEGTYYFEDTVQVETLPGSTKFYKQGEGKLIQTVNETRLECTYFGEPYEMVRSAKSLESMHIEYDYHKRGDCVDISIPDESFWCYLSKRDAITKLSFATEEIHKFAMKKQENKEE